MRALVMTINSNLPPQIHEAQVEAFEKENVKDENLHGMDKESETRLNETLYIKSKIVPMAQHGSRHRHLCQQMLDMFKDEGRLPETSSLLVQPEIPHWKRDDIAVDFITRLPKTTSSYDTTQVSSWKGVMDFGKRGEHNPRCIGPFKILAKVGTVAYRLELPEQLSRVHSTFHESNLKKCYPMKLKSVGTREEVSSSPGNVKISFRRNNRIPLLNP
ncbi:hypothetical protein Tco_1459410 [Tanacetum coccineum]